ncbi:cell morphogenesis N-terminal-domain-containing protein, partial [Hygrophoropsis aurantiaca]
MGSEGIQITIPDFDDEEFQSTPIPFGRPAGFGAFGGGAGSGSESPTILTPIALPERSDRSYFHSRGDSVASEDSFHSQPARNVPKPFAHTSQSSITTTSSSPFSKKPSFASIRNAFKSSSSKHSEVPPMPTIDHQAYPILKNPFNRSTSSLAHLPSTSKPNNAISPPHPRPPTPSNEARPRAPSRSRGHSTARSQHSQSGSIFQSSDTGSDLGHGFSYASSPPPVPRMPNAFGLSTTRGDSPPIPEEDEKFNLGPKTPSDYALHAVFIRFATLAEAKIDVFLRESLDHEPLLSDFMGPMLDEKFDDLLRSLGKIAQKQAKPVIDSIMRWRRSHNENIGGDILKYHNSKSPPWNRGGRTQEPSAILNERKSLASIYIMCRALIAVLQMVSKDALGDATGYSLEETTFEQFKRPDLKLLAQSANHRINAELYATMLGHLGNVRFVSVTDRFLSEFGPVASGQVVKDFDTRYENLVKGLRHVQIKVWPPEAFEEGAEFMESLSKAFENAHGLRFKVAFAETLTRLLHPIGKTAQAEVNHPQWEKAIEKIYPRAKDMMSKPRYWHVAYPLAVTSLCVAPHQYFLRHWMGCFEHGLSKLKEKPYRIPVMNGMVRLIWTYLYRCQEPSSTSTAKLDTLLKHFFPNGRALIFPHEEHLEPFICVVHFVLSRYFEFGRDFCLELLQESSLNASATTIANLPAPERFAISIQAILLTLHAIEREEPTPTWPSSVDFSAVPSWDDYPSSSEILPANFVPKPGIEAFFERYGAVITIVVKFCSSAVGEMSVFDEQWALARYNAAYEEAHSMVIRRHPEGSVAYPNQLVSQISMLQTCFQSWPRCLHSSLPLADAVDMLVRGVIHVEPRVGEIAAAALRRFMASNQYAETVLRRFTMYLFDPAHIVSEGTGARIMIESARLLNLWVSLVEGWINGILQRTKTSITDEEREGT